MGQIKTAFEGLNMILSGINLRVDSTIRRIDIRKITIQMSKFFGKTVPIYCKAVWMCAALLIGFQFAMASPSPEVAGFDFYGGDISAFADWDLPGYSFSGDQPVSGFGLGEDAEDYSTSDNSTVAADYDSLYLTLAVMVGVLLLVVLLLFFVSANLINLVRVREGKEAFTMKGTIAQAKELAFNPYLASFGGFVAFVIGLLIIVPIARGVGLSQGYQPDQPIWFSHAIHAGTYEIDCQYCHSGASKGKNAWIPSVNVCMNCHKAVTEGSVSGTKEISKIYNAYENDIPIEWVRIHNLPDLSYFNHQQHVVAGEVECQTCHGPIEEMDVVYQFAPLSMGWCVNCHRETKVNSDLYDALGRDDVHTVEDIGGTNCARCHY